MGAHYNILQLTLEGMGNNGCTIRTRFFWEGPASWPSRPKDLHPGQWAATAVDKNYPPASSNMAGWTMDHLWISFPIETSI